jgi:hypothetical protein
MAKQVLILGVMAAVLDDVRQELREPDVEFLSGTGVENVRSVFRRADIDHVIIGGGLDLDARAEMVQEIFQSSDRATIHMKDQMSGPQGFLPFVKAVLRGLDDYQPQLSPHAILRSRHPGPDQRS